MRTMSGGENQRKRWHGNRHGIGRLKVVLNGKESERIVQVKTIAFKENPGVRKKKKKKSNLLGFI